MKYYISTNPAMLQAAMDAPENLPSATVEAEFGSTLVTGSRMENGILVGNRTLAHHGIRSANPVPCLHANEDLGLACIGLSHVDLDALGGCMALSGSKPEVPGFWELAAHIDINGPHKIHEAGATDENIRRLRAWCAWSEANRAPRVEKDTVMDITRYVVQCCIVLNQILNDERMLLEAGDKWLAGKQLLNKNSFIEFKGGVIVRVSHEFTSTLYSTPDGEQALAIVAYNPVTGAITVSLADPIDGVSVDRIVKDAWGPDAGGRDTIGGSPRGQRMGWFDLGDAFYKMREAIKYSGALK